MTLDPSTTEGEPVHGYGERAPFDLVRWSWCGGHSIPVRDDSGPAVNCPACLKAIRLAFEAVGKTSWTVP